MRRCSAESALAEIGEQMIGRHGNDAGEGLPQEVSALLQRIGAALDEQMPLKVYNRGIVALGSERFPLQLKDNIDERQRTTRPSAGSRKGTTRRKGAAGGSRPPSAEPRIVGLDELRITYQEQVGRLAEAYPSLETFPDHDGMWLSVRSAVLDRLPREAAFLVFLPFEQGVGPRAWAFWITNGEARWIGPRHTNMDGSICAFSSKDRAWIEGGDLRTLLDLYSVWALRHLHLEFFHRWPGKQYALEGVPPDLQAYYRRTQCGDDELCACGSETLRYKECCKPFDLKANIVDLTARFLKRFPGGFERRRAPTAAIKFMEGRSAGILIADIYAW